jgi:HK97 gp10 family phage protein
MAGFNLFPMIASAVPGILAQIVDETADECVGNIKGFILSNGQVDTGNMLNGITKEDGPDAQTKDIMSAMYYWKFQNYGTRYLPARPFVEPGVAQTRPGFEARLATFESRLP